MVLLTVFNMILVRSTVVMAEDDPSRSVSTIIYVDANTGDDITGDGTQAKPYKTLAKAEEAIRALPKNNGDIIVQIGDVFYLLDETLVFDENDSRSESSTVRYVAVPGAELISLIRK